MASDKVRIFVKMTPEEKSRIRERMSEAGFKNLSAYVRKMLLNGYVINLDLSDVKEVLRLLHINSNNLLSNFFVIGVQWRIFQTHILHFYIAV